MRLKIYLILIAMIVIAGTAQASTLTLSGFLNDPANPALVGSDLGPALFDNDNDIANNVALYNVTIPVAGSVEFLSLGFAKGGVEPYFTLFDGFGSTATFVDSNFFIFDIDFNLTRPLSAGNYTAAIGVWENMSFAENSGFGTLNDGFTRLGVPEYLGNYYYEVKITYPGPTIPEPATWLLVLPGLAVILLRCRKS